jgi:cytoskeletal protein RodZ
MELTSPLRARLICGGLVLALLAPSVAIAQDEKDEKQDTSSVPQASQASSPSPSPSADSGTPASAESQPAATSHDQLPDSPDGVQPQTAAQPQTSDPAQTPTPAQPVPQAPPQGKTQQPVGAAAAQVESTTGDAAFKPAGAAIAPAKQGRKRMILLKVGALIGAGVAIGSVAALSSASPSRPPGSH